MEKAFESGSEKGPWTVLGIPLDAGEEEIRRAYLRKVKEFPPDRSPEEFERIREAYETLRDPVRRTRNMLMSVDPRAGLTSVLDDHHRLQRRFVGPRPWLAVLKGR